MVSCLSLEFDMIPWYIAHRCYALPNSCVMFRSLEASYSCRKATNPKKGNVWFVASFSIRRISIRQIPAAV